MVKITNTKKLSIVKVVALLAACLYSAWILGYIFNYNVSVVGPASDLMVKGQPLNYLFFWADIFACNLVLLLGMYVYRNFSAIAKPVVIPYVLFGLFTGIAALNPLACTVTQLDCTDAGYSTHIFYGALANICLLIASVLEMARRNRYATIAVAAICAWAVIGMYDIVFQSQGASTTTALLQRILLIIVAYFIYRVPVSLCKTNSS